MGPEAVVHALADLFAEMKRRGKLLATLPNSPPATSRKLANKPALGLHPLICVISECHELFDHPTYGAQAAKVAISVIKQDRKFGIALILNTQSPTTASIPTDVTRNISCGVAFSVGDHNANDGLLGSGRYRAGIRATELRMHTDRGTCVAVGVSDATFELLNTFYVPYADGIDLITPSSPAPWPPSTNCAAPATPPPAMTTTTRPRRPTTWPTSTTCCGGTPGPNPGSAHPARRAPPSHLRGVDLLRPHRSTRRIRHRVGQVRRGQGRPGFRYHPRTH